MLARNDYRCKKCGKVSEYYGAPPSRCTCGGEWEVVFTEPAETITEHASTVLHVIDQNKKLMEEVYEEDAAANSEAMKDLESITHRSVV